MHSLLSNLVQRNSLSLGVDSDRSLFQELSGCCNMLRNSMICSKWHILGTNPLITSKLCMQGQFIMQSRLRQVSFSKNCQVAAKCCKKKNMICSKYYNLETNALITSKLGTQYWIVKWRRFRQVFLQKLSGCCNIQQSYYLLHFAFCSKLKIFVKEILRINSECPTSRAYQVWK